LKNCLLVVGLILIAGMAFAAPIDGKWVGEVAGMEGAPMKISYTFKADGATLTGSTTSPDGKEMAIKDGKIDGNNISFSISFDMGGQEMKMDMKGVLSGDDLKLTMDMMGQPMDIPLKRAK
jgi:alpha-acetolactate decarboxylase